MTDPIKLDVPHGLMFHHFQGLRHPAGQGAITSDQFRRIVLAMDVISADEWLEKFTTGRLTTERCITFDDALMCQYDLAVPVLEERGLKAMFFVYTAHLDGAIPRLEIYRYFRSVYFNDQAHFYASFYDEMPRYVDADEVAHRYRNLHADDRPYFPDFYSEEDRKFQIYRDQLLTPALYQAVMDGMLSARGASLSELLNLVLMREREMRALHAAGHVLGLHSHSHPLHLLEMSREEQRAEYEQNIQWVSKICGADPVAMSHPSNQYSSATVEILTQLGVRVGFRADAQMLRGTAFEVPRLDHTSCRIALGL